MKRKPKLDPKVWLVEMVTNRVLYLTEKEVNRVLTALDTGVLYVHVCGKYLMVSHIEIITPPE